MLIGVPWTTGNCHHFYYKISSSEVLQFTNFGHNLNFYGNMAAITYKKLDQNYSKYIFNKNISHNLQPIRNNKNNIKYYWIILTMSLLFLHKQLYNRSSKIVIVSSVQCTTAFHLMLFVIISPAITQISETLQEMNFFTTEILRITFIDQREEGSSSVKWGHVVQTGLGFSKF